MVTIMGEFAEIMVQRAGTPLSERRGRRGGACGIRVPVGA